MIFMPNCYDDEPLQPTKLTSLENTYNRLKVVDWLDFMLHLSQLQSFPSTMDAVLLRFSWQIMKQKLSNTPAEDASRTEH